MGKQARGRWSGGSPQAPLGREGSARMVEGSESDSGDDTDIASRFGLPCSFPVLAALFVGAIALSVACGAVIGVRVGPRRAKPAATWSSLRVVPSGVNFGGWLVLEDWFFSGAWGRNVMSVEQTGQGACLPPGLPVVNQTWPSEGLLTKRLRDSFGAEATARIFAAHRHSYIGDSDLRKAADLGIRTVRVPLPWAAFADALAVVDAGAFGAHDALLDSVVVPDPVYRDAAAYVTVPRAWLGQLLRQAARYGLRVLFDLHAMPAGASDGTYNGVWPLAPAFWTATVAAGNTSLPVTELGLMIARGFIHWVEGLSLEDIGAVAGVTLMNEPAHMAHIDWENNNSFTRDEAQVLGWLEEAAGLFRDSSLPRRGVKLYVNLIDTTFKDFWVTVPAWWRRTFSQQERRSWAVFDVHWYTAWSPDCNGRVIPGGAYFCDQPIEDIRALLRHCVATFAGRMSRYIDGQKACTEFSLGTFEDAVFACNDIDVLRMFLEEQVSMFQRHSIEPYFWTWRMPYGKSFERGWSLKFIAGLERPPPPHPCVRADAPLMVPPM